MTQPRVLSPHKPVTGGGAATALVTAWCSGSTLSPEARGHGWGANV